MLRREKLTAGTWLRLRQQYTEDRIVTLTARGAFRILYSEDLLRVWDDYEAIRRGAPAEAFPHCQYPFPTDRQQTFARAFKDIYPEEYRYWTAAYAVWVEVEAAEDPQGRFPAQVRWTITTAPVPVWRDQPDAPHIPAAQIAIPAHIDYHRALAMLEQRADHFPDTEILDGCTYKIYRFFNLDLAQALLTRLIFWGYEVIK